MDAPRYSAIPMNPRGAALTVERVAGHAVATARAVRRLGAFAAITLIWMARYASHAAMAGFTRRLAASYARRWSVSLGRAIGVEIETRGAPPDRSALLVANHVSYIDIAVIGSRVAACFLAKTEVARWPVIGWAARLSNAIFVERERPDSRRRSLVEIETTIRSGVNVVVFPEGTTSAGPTTLPFRPGSFALAARAGLVVVPVAIRYEDPGDAWVGDDTFVAHFLRQLGKRRVRVSVSFGPALSGSSGEDLCRAAQNWIDDANTCLWERTAA
ncbi:MAG: 1-acyl-sn-glycerol-3-phosphate acyltransferase [Deltaproteobacteria bacterium]|nr:1-acyl-sn-glycerol-3-phosphate acyltransferase [Deltaproteobacteria bacterium]